MLLNLFPTAMDNKNDFIKFNELRLLKKIKKNKTAIANNMVVNFDQRRIIILSKSAGGVS